MAQTLFPTDAPYPTDRFDIGPGGQITDTPANRVLLGLIDLAQPLSPAELHALAVSYQSASANSKLGHYLAFIALNSIFQHPQMRQYQAALLQQQPDLSIDPCPVCCAIFGKLCRNCHCLPAPEPVMPGLPSVQAKRVQVAGFDLLVEVVQRDSSKTCTVLGVSPNILMSPHQEQNSDIPEDQAPV